MKLDLLHGGIESDAAADGDGHSGGMANTLAEGVSPRIVGGGANGVSWFLESRIDAMLVTLPRVRYSLVQAERKRFEHD